MSFLHSLVTAKLVDAEEVQEHQRRAGKEASGDTSSIPKTTTLNRPNFDLAGEINDEFEGVSYTTASNASIDAHRLEKVCVFISSID